MISSQYKFIYLHVPKTGGNSIQSVLLPMSDDSLIIREVGDGYERFGISGAITSHKHNDLSCYAKAIGDQCAAYRIVMSVRNPFERAISHYFSPHR